MTYKHIVIIGVMLLCAMGASARAVDDGSAIVLPAPDTAGGKPLMQAFKERQSIREYDPRDLGPQMLSDLLWAARGINRPESGRLTSPTAKNYQEIDVYVALKSGLYLYDANEHLLRRVIAKDIRALTGDQPFVAGAPVNLIFVADLSRMGGFSQKDAEFYAATDTGFVSENVYLYCSSTGLATVVRGWLDRERLARAMGLRADQKVILAQTVGYPAGKGAE